MTENMDERQNAMGLPPEVIAQLQQYSNIINPKMVAVTIIATLSNGSAEIKSAYNPNGLYITISDEAPEQRNVEETPETEG